MPPRKNKKSKSSTKPKKVKIFAIVDLTNKRLMSVGLNEEDIWFEFDLGLYDPDQFRVAKLEYLI
jgi:hypothetical protein